MIRQTASALSIVVISGFCFVPLCQASEGQHYFVGGAPEGFESFVTFTKGPIRIQIPGERATTLQAEYRFGEVRVLAPSAQKELFHYLEQSSVEPEVISYILEQLKAGGLNSPLCQGDTQTCSIAQADVEYVFDYETRVMRIFLNPIYFIQRQQQIEFADGKNTNLGVINNFNAFTSVWGEQGLALTVNDDSWLSLPYGHLRSDLSYYSGSNGTELDANELSYNLDVGRHSLGAGRFRYGKNFNSTAFLDYEVSPDTYSFYFGSSSNLVLNDTRQQQSLGFYASEQGTLKIQRDDRIILQRNVLDGRGSISYADLPSGIYEVDIIVEAAGKVLSRERKTIVNVSRFSLSQGAVDYSIQGGEYVRSSFSIDSDKSLDGQAYLKSAISYRPAESVMVGGEVLTAGSDYNAKLGIYGYLNNDTNVQLISSYFENRSNYLRVLLNTGTTTIDYSDYSYYPDTINTTPNLASYLLGSATYRNLSWSRSFTLGSGAGYASLYYREEQNYDALIDDIEYTGINIGYTVPFLWDSTLNLSSNYAIAEGNDDNWQVGVNWSLPLGDSTSIRTSILSSGHENQIRTGAERRWDIDAQTRTMVSAGVQHDKLDIKYDMSATLDAQREWGETSLYSYADSRGSRGMTSTLSSTQVIKNNNVFYTARPAKSYILAETKEVEDSQYGVLKIIKDQSAHYNFGMKDRTTLIPVDGYASLTGSIDVDGTEYQYVGKDDFSYFSYPGSIYALTNELYKINYFLAYIPNTTSDELSCTGDACLSIEQQRQGIFKITVKAAQPFTLYKEDDACYQAKLGLAENQNLGKLSCK
ncbi:exported hypothetical protein [Vibrio coralliirubri]|uniref:TcfC E-set like domain-containing protein n=1 Tax=Vibrio coralliirubri TaxID=1516159 RepID=UPI0006397158|nr:TcfC E-set like domain-containing protein [Vibrio coralliirubri]CDT67791.1 exported hypothetical protein [Vibrio coralliirubri]